MLARARGAANALAALRAGVSAMGLRLERIKLRHVLPNKNYHLQKPLVNVGFIDQYYIIYCKNKTKI